MSNPGSGTRVSVDGVKFPQRGTLDIRTARHVGPTVFDDPTNNTTHLYIETLSNVPAIGFGRIKYDTFGGTNPISVSDVIERAYDVLVVQTAMSTTGNDIANAAAEKAITDQIHAANPSCVILMYRVAIERASDTSGQTTFTKPAQNTPEMYLYASDGTKYTYNFAGGNPQMDFGDAAYRTVATSRAINMCVAGGYNGWFVDNMLLSPRANGQYSTLLPTAGTLGSDPNYNGAWDGYLDYAVPLAAANGLIIMGNLSNLPTVDAYIAANSHFDHGLMGGLDESFFSAFSTTASVFFPATVTGGPFNSDGSVVSENALKVSLHIKRPKFMMAHSYIQGGPFNNTGNNTLVFYQALCAALLGDMIFSVDNGSDCPGGGSYSNYTAGRTAGPWLEYYNRARELGQPLGKYQLIVANGLYRRAFEHGVVLVNSSNSSSTDPDTGLVINAHGAGIFLYRRFRSTQAYGPSVTPLDWKVGFQRLNVTDAVAWTYNLPANTPTASDFQEFMWEVKNTTAGAIATPTFNAAYVFPAGAYASPGAGKSRLYRVVWGGSNWLIIQVSTADY